MADAPNKLTHAERRRQEAKNSIRLRLKAGQYIRRLHEIIAIAPSLEPSQVPAYRLKADILGKLLNKCVPDLKAIEHSGELSVYDASELTDAQLADIAIGRRERAIEQAQLSQEPDQVH